MLDINFIRENPDIVKHDLKKRELLDRIKWVDDLIIYDEEWRRLKRGMRLFLGADFSY